jgi:hypothetical protein
MPIGALGGTGFDTGRVANVSTLHEMPKTVERLIRLCKKPRKNSVGNLGEPRPVGLCEERRGTAADGRF